MRRSFLHELFYIVMNEMDKGTVGKEDSQTSEGQVEEDCMFNTYIDRHLGSLDRQVDRWIETGR